MQNLVRSLVLAGVAAVGSFGLGATPARAQAFGFSYASPGLSFGVGRGAFGGFYGGPVVAPAPVVVAPAPVVVPPPPVIVAPRPYVYGAYYGGYRPYYRGYYRRW